MDHVNSQSTHRTLSRQFHLDFDLPSVAVTHMTTQMGQFIDHDLTLTPEEHEDRCCEQPQRPTCMAIEVEDGDEFFSHEVIVTPIVCHDAHSTTTDRAAWSSAVPRPGARKTAATVSR